MILMIFTRVPTQKDGCSMVASIIPFNYHMMIQQQQVIGGGVPYLLSIHTPPPSLAPPPPSSPLPLTLARYTKTTLHLPCCRPCSLLSSSLSRVKKTIVSSVKKFKPIEKHVLFYQKACSKN